ncbi:winged helix-turn-helix transcriptional regulator [Corynebacterium lubricantis]|uniref:winged helix-turn-helix transcriptional regulator n=1 Tax=Corynebacterium lubricantis TaxID=541095 RepID=UPI000477226D|nr:helix-turn-helix domain-containing protein [Corynebacterium lubricantis]
MAEEESVLGWNPFSRNCASRGLLNSIGDKWAILILASLADGALRFGELEEAVDGISQKMLAQRLGDMVADGLVTRAQFQEVPPRVEYELTDLGRSALPAVQGLIDWTVGHMSQVYETRQK